MNKSEIIKSKIARAQFHLEQADKLQQEAFGELQQEAFGELAELGCYDLHNGIEEILSEMDDLLMEVCIPLEMNTLDLGDGRYDAREGNEDSFSNLDK
jgi:hypothetical protein